MSALGLALGIGFQNLPEGAAVSLPMKTALKSPHKAFYYGICSAVVEPIFAVIGYLFIGSLQPLQPWLLAFAAGAMLFVVADELLPQTKGKTGCFGGWGFMIGFACMMILDLL
jgi:ZIP family zinc transporter